MRLAELETEPDVTPKCPIGRLLVDLDTEDSDKLDEWLADETRSSAWIETRVRRIADHHGWKRPGKQSVGKHRRGGCSCD